MKKYSKTTAILSTMALMAVTAVAVLSPGFYKSFSPLVTTGLTFEVNASYESITTVADGWMVRAGGQAADTHYARIKYKLPENDKKVLTEFYAKTVIVLPDDFYTQQKAGFRILNTDNFPTSLGGALNNKDLRVGVNIYSDHKMRLIVDHDGGIKTVLWTSAAPLPVGEHTIELYGDVSKVAPWYLMIDGQVVASGNTMLATSDTQAGERVVTRIMTGIDGAADQDNNAMEFLVKSFEIRDADPHQVVITPVTSAVTITISTNTPVPGTATRAPTIIPPSATFTATPMPAAGKITVNGTLFTCPCKIEVP